MSKADRVGGSGERADGGKSLVCRGDIDGDWPARGVANVGDTGSGVSLRVWLLMHLIIYKAAAICQDEHIEVYLIRRYA